MIKTIVIDEEGFFLLQDGIRLTDQKVGQGMLSQIFVDEFGVTHLHYDGEEVIVEAFDKPYVARMVHLEKGQLEIQLPYQLRLEVDLKSICVDEWDRFHGITVSQVPFVLCRAAQAELFNLADEYEDDSITLAGQKIETAPYYLTPEDINNEKFWTGKYLEMASPGFNLEQPHPELASALQQLKIYKSRILVPGCGFGHDAALLAQKGHIVTAIDISPEAIKGAKQRYGHIENLEFIEANVFDLDPSFEHSFDLIFEHTFYCAVTTDLRDQVIKLWKKLLDDTGHILGIFFVVPKRTGPYFGGSEWELREKLQNRFRFLYWTRLHHSPGWRKGAELMVYAQINEPLNS